MPSKTAQTTPQTADEIGADGIPNVDYPETAEQRAARGERIKSNDADFSGGGEIVKAERKRTFDDAQLAGMTSFAEAAAALNSVTTVESMADYGNGFSLLDSKQKRRLVDVPFLIVEWQNNTGDTGDFVSVEIVTKHDERFIINDGSLGICAQLKHVEARRIEAGHHAPRVGLMVPRGLREANYNNSQNGQPTTTYYLNTDKS